MPQYLNAAHVFCFCQLNEDYKASTNPIEYVDNLGFLHPNEVKVFTKSTGATRENPHAGGSSRLGQMHAIICVGWARQLMHSTFADGTIAPPMLSHLNAELNLLTHEIMRIYAFRDMPIPFMYFQYVSQNLWITCMLLTYATATTGEMQTLITSVAIGIMLLGLREVSIMLSDPFGEDLSDLPALDYVHTTVLDTEMIAAALSINTGVEHLPPPPKPSRARGAEARSGARHPRKTRDPSQAAFTDQIAAARRRMSLAPGAASGSNERRARQHSGTREPRVSRAW